MLANNDFGNDLLKDLIPYVEANFRTVNKADQRAMAGLSMGGAHTIRNGLTHPELFHYDRHLLDGPRPRRQWRAR